MEAPDISIPSRAIYPATPILLIALFALLPPIGVFAALGVAPLLAILAVVALALAAKPCWRAIWGMREFALAFAAVGVWGIVTALWSTIPDHSLLTGARFLTISASGLLAIGVLRLFGDAERERLTRVLAISFVATVVVFLADFAFGFPLVRLVAGLTPDQPLPMPHFDRGTTVLGLLFWPVSLGLWTMRRRWLWVALAVAMLAAFVVIPSSTNRLAFLVGIVVWMVARWRPRLVAGAMIVGIVAVAIATPVVMPRAFPTPEAIVPLHHEAPWIKFSALHRFLIWRFASQRFLDRPWLGWGMDASRELPGGHENLAAELSEPVLNQHAEALPLHPHNGILQWEVELGIPGAALCIAIVAFLIWRIGAGHLLAPPVQAAALACTAAGLTITLLGYGIWQAWWLSSLWCVAALFARPLRGRGDKGASDQEGAMSDPNNQSNKPETAEEKAERERRELERRRRELEERLEREKYQRDDM